MGSFFDNLSGSQDPVISGGQGGIWLFRTIAHVRLRSPCTLCQHTGITLLSFYTCPPVLCYPCDRDIAPGAFQSVCLGHQTSCQVWLYPQMRAEPDCRADQVELRTIFLLQPSKGSFAGRSKCPGLALDGTLVFRWGVHLFVLRIYQLAHLKSSPGLFLQRHGFQSGAYTLSVAQTALLGSVFLPGHTNQGTGLQQTLLSVFALDLSLPHGFLMPHYFTSNLVIL